MNVSRLAGRGFQSGATVELRQGATAIRAAEVKVSVNVDKPSVTDIECKIDLTGAPAGSYDVVVRSQDGQEAVYAGGFAVGAPGCGTGSATAVLVFGLMMGLLSVAGTGRIRRRKRRART